MQYNNSKILASQIFREACIKKEAALFAASNVKLSFFIRGLAEDDLNPDEDNLFGEGRILYSPHQLLYYSATQPLITDSYCG